MRKKTLVIGIACMTISLFCSCGAAKTPATATINTVESRENTADDIINDKLDVYTMPEDIEVHVIDEAKNNSNNSDKIHEKAVLDDNFISKYIDVSQFNILKTWVLNGISKSKNSFDITEAKFEELKEDISATYKVLANSSINLESKRQTLYNMLQTVLDESDLDLSEFNTSKENAKNFGSDTGMGEDEK